MQGRPKLHALLHPSQSCYYGGQNCGDSQLLRSTSLHLSDILHPYGKFQGHTACVFSRRLLDCLVKRDHIIFFTVYYMLA